MVVETLMWGSVLAFLFWSNYLTPMECLAFGGLIGFGLWNFL